MHENYANIWEAVAQQRPEWTAIVAGQERLDYGSFDDRARSFAANLAAGGVSRGDRVAFYLHNSVEFLVAFYACLKLEAIPVAFNYRYRAGEAYDLILASTPKAIIYKRSSRETVAELHRLVDAAEASPSIWIEVDDSAEATDDVQTTVNAIGFDEMLTTDTTGSASPTRASGDGEIYMFTGGTTGAPKAVVWSIGELMQIQRSSTYPPVGVEPPRTFEEAVRIATDEDVRHVITLPLAPFIHATALFMSMNTLNLGGTVVINPSPSLDPEAAVDLAIEQKVTQLVVAGDAVALPVIGAFERHPARADIAVTSVLSSGMRFSDDVKLRFHQLKQMRIIDILASSEGGPFAMGVTSSVNDLPTRLSLTAEAVVLDDQNHEVQGTPGASGVLAFKGPLPRGYLNDPKKSAESYPVINGIRHVRPGDYVKVLEGGNIELLGRGSAVINTGGEKIYPAEVEERLLKFPGVYDAAVFGLPDERLGEKIAAVVAVRSDANVTVQNLQDWVAAELAGYKKPRTISIRASLDRSPAGKLNLARAKELASDSEEGEIRNNVAESNPAESRQEVQRRS
jgi:acyl-CoA synthetase (AMP-forming)/AMP-acid ligase II